MSTKKKIKLKKEDIKYEIYNTALPVFITHDDKVFFDIDPKDERAIFKNDIQKIQEYDRKASSTLEYLKLEGFLPESIVI